MENCAKISISSKGQRNMKCNLLLSLMQLEIGGAETHVVELAKELKKRGYHVVVTSNGGVYEKELADAGIKHYRVPLQNKNPKNVLHAFRELRRIIEEEKIDLVHSHARIPSFILGRLHKKMHFPFVTTAHWVFTTKYGLKYITDWGQKTLAVSEDIKKYLMDNYHIPESDIIVTINGIDTEKFSPDTDDTEVRKEFGLSSEDHVITYVSRMDQDRSLVAHQLIAAMQKLDPLIGNLKLLIVGGGSDFDAVQKEAGEMNQILGREAILLAGARTDINRLVAPADLFVGVSRAALEAMAAAKPTIIAGNEGYIGLFDKDKIDLCFSTNFCCRGCPQPETETLANEIGAFFGMWDEDREKLGQFSREFVKERYSVKKMTDDTERLYRMVLKK